MKNIIVGTAGHIDHGKTTLIRALTGRNTDRWEEEQRRGITIDLGFTWFDLPSGNRVGIIDVPGHEKFVNNMVAGVVGMDLVLLVIAADEGIMPQTREHVDILGLLGIEKCKMDGFGRGSGGRRAARKRPVAHGGEGGKRGERAKAG